MKPAHTFVQQPTLIVEGEAVGDPIVNLQHGGNARNEQIHTSRYDGHVNASSLEVANQLPCTRHQPNSRVGTEEVVLMDGVLYGFPQRNVRSHEGQVIELPCNEALEVRVVVRPK